MGVLGALAVEAFRTVLFALEMGLVGAHDGHLVPAARELEPEIRLLVPAIGGPAVGMLLWLAEGAHSTKLSRFRGDYIEAVAIGNGRLDLRGGVLKILASLVVVSTGGAVGREGAMILFSAMAASWIGRLAGETLELRLMVSCGAAAGLAAAYHTPLAGAVFVAEILLGSLVLAQLGPVVVAAVVSHGITIALVGPGIRFPMATVPTLGASQAMVMLAFAPISGIAGAALLYWLELARGRLPSSPYPYPCRWCWAVWWSEYCRCGDRKSGVTAIAASASRSTGCGLGKPWRWCWLSSCWRWRRPPDRERQAACSRRRCLSAPLSARCSRPR